MQNICYPSLQFISIMQEQSTQFIEQEINTKIQSPIKGQLEVYEFQVSGKTPKYINNTDGTIYKQYSQAQFQFYQFFNTIPKDDSRAQLKPFIPEYLGTCVQEDVASGELDKAQNEGGNNRTIWIQHIASRSKSQASPCQHFLLLRNLTFGFAMPNIIDLKLGVKKSKKSNIKFEKTTTNSHKFRINGLVVGLKQGESYTECFMSKYHGQQVTVDDTETYLSLFFFDGQQILSQLLHRVILRLDDLIASFRNFTGVHFISSSLFLAYDALSPDKFTLNLIDFDKYEHTTEDQIDSVIAEGLGNVSIFLQGVLTNREAHLQRLLKRDLNIFKEDQKVITQEAMEKYSK